MTFQSLCPQLPIPRLLVAKVVSLEVSLEEKIDNLKKTTSKNEELAKELNDASATCENLQQLKSQYDHDNEEVGRWLCKNDHTMDGDAASSPWIPLANQLLELAAEDLTLADVIHHLCKKLASQDLSFDAWYEVIRDVTRKQFEVRALRLKCQEALHCIPTAQPLIPPPLLPAAPLGGGGGVLSSLSAAQQHPSF
eukprot:GGOE01001861.1.p1 GENE.GGOE01001861.1~~GGOE01001861.1.p1  ORF type:complete len:195 (+),score=46.10 GGOE01001861.1:433-1017(+)